MRFFFASFLLFALQASAHSDAVLAIKCDADSTQSYSICLPPNYSKAQKYPVLFLFDPAARGKMAATLYQKAASEYGFILIASNNSRNGPMSESLNVANALFADAFKKYSIDDGQVYLAGFSGGARVATTIALQTGGIAGVIACGAGFGEPVPKTKLDWTFAGIAGTRDFNYVELQQVVPALQVTGTLTNLLIFKGPHTWPPAEVFISALLWSYLQHQKPGTDNAAMQKQLQTSLAPYQVKVPADAIAKELIYQQKIAEAFQLMMMNSPDTKSKSWWRGERSALNKVLLTSLPADSDYVARQTSFISANASESFGNYYGAKKYDTAAELLTVSEIFEPDNPVVFYRHALLAAATKDEDNTIYYLEQAVKHGFSNKAQMRNNPIFSFLKDNKRYQALLN
jgi:pimeloyl-ACP methyl ester carboxylesterase